jgi:hypothetical protein
MYFLHAKTYVSDPENVAGVTVSLPTEGSAMLWQKKVPEYQQESKVVDNLMSLWAQDPHPCQSWGLLPLLMVIMWVV